MIQKLFFVIVIVSIMGCASGNKYKDDIPLYKLSIGMTKGQVVNELGQPHKLLSSEIRNGSTYDTWAYRKDEQVWVTGNAWMGGTQRLESTIYLLDFKNQVLGGWRDNAMQERTKSENTYEIRQR